MAARTRSRPRRSAARSSMPRCASSPGRASTRAGCRDIAEEAGVAYGLVYHYFRSKDEVLDTLFLERWNVMLDVIARHRLAGRSRRATSSTRSPRSSGTPTATTPS